MASAQGLIRALLAVVGLGMLFWLLAPQIQWAFHSATASSRAYPAHVPTETLPKDHDRDGSPQGPSSTPVAAPEERLRAARVVQTTESPALAHLTSHATPRPLNHTARPSTEPEPERATEPLAEAGNQSLGEEAEEPRVLERPGTFIAAGHLPKASKARVQPTGNIIMGNTKTVDLWEMVQQNTLSTVGCAGNATCPDLIQCANQRYVCTHNPLDLHAPPDFHMRDYYAEAYQDDKVFVLPNAIHLWNGNIVGLQKGVRPMHLPVGMCPWGVINSAKTDIMSMSLHLNRAASMVHPYAVNFYHFLAETLPKYYVLGPLLRTYKDTKLITAHKWARLIDIWFPQDNFTARSHNMKMWGAGKPKTKPKKGDHVYKYVAANQLFIQVQPRCGSPPMAHIAERAVSHYQSMMLGYSVYCCPDPNQLTMYLKEVHPQLAFGVPRVWEKIYNGVNAALAADPDRKAQFDDGVNAAIEIRRSNLDGDFTDEQQATLDFLDGVAFSNVRALVGLDAVELAITGAAPVPVPPPIPAVINTILVF